MEAEKNGFISVAGVGSTAAGLDSSSVTRWLVPPRPGAYRPAAYRSARQLPGTVVVWRRVALASNHLADRIDQLIQEQLGFGIAPPSAMRRASSNEHPSRRRNPGVWTARRCPPESARSRHTVSGDTRTQRAITWHFTLKYQGPNQSEQCRSALYRQPMGRSNGNLNPGTMGSALRSRRGTGPASQPAEPLYRRKSVYRHDQSLNASTQAVGRTNRAHAAGVAGRPIREPCRLLCRRP